MGNNPSLHLDRVRRRSSTVSMVPPLAKEELELLVTQTGLSAEEVKENYNRFCTSGHGTNMITRQVFSEIMAKCFPRTYKVVCTKGSKEQIFRLHYGGPCRRSLRQIYSVCMIQMEMVTLNSESFF